MLKHVQIRAFGHGFAVQRRITIGLHIAVRFVFAQGHIIGVRGGGARHKVPHFQKCYGKRINARPFQHQARILPHAAALLAVDVLVRKVQPAGESCFTVHDGDLAVVSVVEHFIVRDMQRKMQRIEYMALDARAAYLFVIITGQCEHGTEAVVDQAHVHARGGFFLKHGQRFVPHFAFFNDKIFHEDIFLRAADDLQKTGEKILPHGIILALRVAVERGRGVAGQIFHAAAKSGLPGVQGLCYRIVLHHGGGRGPFDVCKFARVFGGDALVAPPQVEYRPCNGQGHHNEQPHDFVSGIDVVAFDHGDDHQHADQREDDVSHRTRAAEYQHERRKKSPLACDQKPEQECPGEQKFEYLFHTVPPHRRKRALVPMLYSVPYFAQKK